MQWFVVQPLFSFESCGDNEVRFFWAQVEFVQHHCANLCLKQFKDSRQINKPVVVRSQKIK